MDGIDEAIHLSCSFFSMALPSGKTNIAMENLPFLIGDIHLQSGSIFYCYVSLPECTLLGGSSQDET